MILTAADIAARLNERSDDPLAIVPRPQHANLEASAEASVNLRLGTWFAAPRAPTTALLDIKDEATASSTEAHLLKMRYTRFGDRYIVHPGNFVLGVTLEWIRLPLNLTGYVVGKSSWGRRGLIIETAMGVHPGFAGCLTLELANVGEIPIAVRPGMFICQLFLHQTLTPAPAGNTGSFIAYTRPVLGTLKLDPIAARLARKKST